MHSDFIIPCEYTTFTASGSADDGITLFAFHGQLNVPFDGHEAGTWSRDVMRVKHGRFTFRDCNTKLQSGDVIYFWTFVVRNGLGLHQDDGIFVVDTNSNRNAVVSPSCGVRQSARGGGFRVPPAELTILHPRGFEVFIPGGKFGLASLGETNLTTTLLVS